MSEAFISYSRADTAFADKLSQAIQEKSGSQGPSRDRSIPYFEHDFE